MKRVRWVEHQGKQILIMDVVGAKREDQLEICADYAEAVRELPDQSLCLVVLAGPIDFHSDVAIKAKSALLVGQPKVLRSALVGVEGIVKVMAESFFTVARLLGMTVNEDRGRHFETQEEAMDWLAKG